MQDNKKCKKEKEKLWIHYKPSLFQHIGTHSSLKVFFLVFFVLDSTSSNSFVFSTNYSIFQGEGSEAEGPAVRTGQLFVPHKNPSASIESPIKHYKHHSLVRAYQGDTFFWGLVPQAGDAITISFEVGHRSRKEASRTGSPQLEIKTNQKSNLHCLFN